MRSSNRDLRGHKSKQTALIDADGTVLGDSAEDEHSGIAESEGIQLGTEPPTECLRVRADAEGVRTIIDN